MTQHCQPPSTGGGYASDMVTQRTLEAGGSICNTSDRQVNGPGYLWSRGGFLGDLRYLQNEMFRPVPCAQPRGMVQIAACESDISPAPVVFPLGQNLRKGHSCLSKFHLPVHLLPRASAGRLCFVEALQVVEAVRDPELNGHERKQTVPDLQIFIECKEGTFTFPSTCTGRPSSVA